MYVIAITASFLNGMTIDCVVDSIGGLTPIFTWNMNLSYDSKNIIFVE